MKSKVKTRHTFKHQKLYITNIKKSIQSPVTGERQTICVGGKEKERACPNLVNVG